MHTPLALLGLPSVEDIVTKVVGSIWGVLADSLTPDYLKNASGKFFSWMVTVPNPVASGSKNVLLMQDYMTGLSFSVFTLVMVLVAARYYVSSLASSNSSPAEGFMRLLGAVAMLLVYKWAFTNAIAFVNVITHQIFSWPLVQHGLADLTESIFKPHLVGPLAGLFQLMSLFLILALVAVKIALTIVIVMLFIGGTFVIALWPLPETSGFAKSWFQAFGQLLAVPIVWTLLFACAAVVIPDLPALMGFGKSGFAKAATSGLLTPIFTMMILWIGFKSATGAFATLKATGHSLIAHAAPGGRGAAAGFAAGIAGGEARSRVRDSIRSGTGSGGGGGMSALRNKALAAGTGGASVAATAAAGGAATAAAQGTGAASSRPTPQTPKTVPTPASPSPSNGKPSVAPPSPGPRPATASPATPAPDKATTPKASPNTPIVPTPQTQSPQPTAPAAARPTPRPIVTAAPSAPHAGSSPATTPRPGATPSPGRAPSPSPQGARSKIQRSTTQPNSAAARPTPKPAAPKPKAPATPQPRPRASQPTPTPRKR